MFIRRQSVKCWYVPSVRLLIRSSSVSCRVFWSVITVSFCLAASAWSAAVSVFPSFWPPAAPASSHRAGTGARHVRVISDRLQVLVFTTVDIENDAAVERLDFSPVCHANIIRARAEEWRPLIRRCVLNDRGQLLTDIAGLVQAPEAPSPTAQQRLEQWHHEGERRFLQLLSQTKELNWPVPIKKNRCQLSYLISFLDGNDHLATSALVLSCASFCVQIRP